MAKKSPHDAILKQLRAFGLAYPGVHFKSPWPGHMDLAVNDKTFAYLSLEGEPLGISCKLPQSSHAALMLPFTKPTEYGLGKSGWVSASFEFGDDIDIEMLQAWIDESYRAQAPKKLIRELEERRPPAPTHNELASKIPAAASKSTGTKKKAAASAKTRVAKKKTAISKSRGSNETTAAKKRPAGTKATTKKKSSAKKKA